ncbi:MAG: M20 family metallopeptidase [Clostridia bacterium]|nr:M20 family metallopeptidase [Clostridia bacterium]
MFKEYIKNNSNEVVASVCDLITYPSVSSPEESSRFPFGKPCSEALKYFLNLAQNLGFRTKNVDGYCGYAECGEGEELIGIIGHLDVVPAKDEDWAYPPFIPTIRNNCIYGRGTIDDKGPVIASLYAMKAVLEYYKSNNIKMNKRVRLIVGLNEEKDWKCINYYKEHEELPTVSFSPDGSFPVIFAEKGVLSLLISARLPQNLPVEIESLDCNNNAINVVPKFASCILKINKNFKAEYIISILKDIITNYSYEIDIYKIDENNIKLTSYGTASHSAHPELGVNAITKLLTVLNALFDKINLSIPILSTFCKYIGDDYSGSNMKINIKDESGALTLNTSQIYIKDNKINIGINLRVPIHTSMDDIINIFYKYFGNFSIGVIRTQKPLYVDKNDNLVTTLCSVFNKVCNTNFEPIAIGGATYARAFDNCVSFGMNFPGDEDMCHKVDEFIEIDKLLLATNIYANAIYKLLE